jgi:hypothetical protein
MLDAMVRPPTATTASGGLKPVAVTLIATSAGTFADGLFVGDVPPPPHAVVLKSRTATTYARCDVSSPMVAQNLR